VTLRDERRDFATVKILHGVTLLESLAALIEVLKERDARGRV